MTPQEITDERLERWKRKLALDNATPIALVGIGQGDKSGKVVLCIPENGPSDAEIAQLLRAVAAKLR